jgi:predicted transcriptional regulator
MTRASFEPPVACDVILWIVNHRPGISEAELAEAMYGTREQSRVHQDCDLLESKGLIDRQRDTRPMRLYPRNSK